MDPICKEIRDGLKDADRFNIDETPMPRKGVSAHMWTIVSAISVFITLAASRGTAVLEHYCPYTDRPVTCDGYTAYRIFRILQCCWAHMLRESRDAASGGPGPERPHRMSKRVFADVKELQRKIHYGTGPAIALLE